MRKGVKRSFTLWLMALYEGFLANFFGQIVDYGERIFEELENKKKEEKFPRQLP